MRWLLLKDLQILRRSPLLTALLVIYPIVLAVLIGLAVSRGPDKPTVAFLNEVPETQTLELGGEDGDSGFNQDQAFAELCGRVECVRASSRDDALDKVRDGEVLAALIVPEDFITKLEAQLSGAGLESADVEVFVNEDDPLKAQVVDDRISALLTEANLILSDRISETLISYLDLLVKGGEFSLPLLGEDVNFLGLKRVEQILRDVRGQLAGPEREVVDEVIRFAELTRQNLGFARPVLASVSEPISIEKEVVSGSVPPLDTFAIAVAIAVTLMFVTVLLVAGSLALEREENTFARLTPALVSRSALLVEKIGLGTICSVVVAVVLLGVLELFVNLAWERAPLIMLAIVFSGAAFAAMGSAIGAAAREVRASALAAFALTLPIAFLSLVPSGTVSEGLFDTIRFVTGAFPFRPALDALSAGLSSAGPDIGPPLLHLALLTLAYFAIARLALRRFA
ncbi:MAG TPA: ABC transporter permease [Solirubrobacterales bacterium]|nr:ABC transporter permease [Solirubrobacterales bacterium]